MLNVAKGIEIPAIVKPGCFYLFTEDEDPGAGIDTLELAYIITKQEEILPALDIEMNITLAEMYIFEELKSCKRIRKNCYEFSMSGRWKDSDEKATFRLYLHRLISFQEKLYKMKK